MKNTLSCGNVANVANTLWRRIFKSVSLMAIGLMFLFSVVSAYGSATNYVSSTNGDDANTGADWGNAWLTLTNAVAQSASGDTVVLSNGVYTLAATLTIDKALTVSGFGASPEDVIIEPATSTRINLVTLSHADAVIENLTVRNGGRGIYLNGGGTVRWCVISGNVGSSTAGVYLLNGGLVEYCVIRENSSNYTGSGAHLNGAGCVLRNSLIINNSGGSGNGFGGGVYLVGSTDAVVENCTIVRNYAWQAGGGRLFFSERRYNQQLDCDV